MSNIEFGSVSQIWLAPAEDLSAKQSFLVRDDAYAVTEASFGRQVRLGQPIDLGPAGSWNQDGWFGGYDQERWYDEYMFREGDADVTDRIGRVKLWPGWKHIFNLNTSKEFIEFGCLIPSGSGSGADTPLLVCERGREPGTAEGSWRAFTIRDDHDFSEVRTITEDLGEITAITPIASESSSGAAVGAFLLGTQGGRIYRWLPGEQFGLDVDSPEWSGGRPIGRNAMIGFNGAVYYGRSGALWRRVSGTHTTVKALSNVDRLAGFCVWQNRLWFLGSAAGGRSYLFTSDGVTVAQVLEFPHGLSADSMCAHYGSLYIGAQMDKTPGDTLSTTGQVWRYNGSSLQKIWDGKLVNEEAYGVESIVSWDRFVAWPKDGFGSGDKKAGVWLYDAEEDAILEGPCMDMDPAATRYKVTSLGVWNGSLVAGFKDMRTVDGAVNPSWVAYVRRDGMFHMGYSSGRPPTSPNDGHSFRYQPSWREGFVESSSYDADLAAEKKLWLTGRVKAKIPTDCQLVVELVPDEGSPVEVAAFTGTSATPAWETYTFTCDDSSGKHLQSTEMAYRLTLRHPVTQAALAQGPEVDHVSFQFMPAASRRRQWYMRIVCSDNQDTLAGTANTLDTRKKLVDKLKDLWLSNGVLAFWEGPQDGTTPSDADAIKVTLSNFSDQPWRLSSTSDEVMSETSFSLLEVNPTT